MKRRLTIEVDDVRFPRYLAHEARASAEELLGHLVGQVEYDGQRTTVPFLLARDYGVTLIADEQID